VGISKNEQLIVNHDKKCRNPSFGLATKAKACKVTGQEGSLRITPHAPGSVGKCEGMNLHTPKGVSTLGVVILVDSQIFEKVIARVKTQQIEKFFILLKSS
jgi:hypothetical protein